MRGLTVFKLLLLPERRRNEGNNYTRGKNSLFLSILKLPLDPWPGLGRDPDSLHVVAHSESPYSEHGALEEVENEGGTETHTSEDGEWQ